MISSENINPKDDVLENKFKSRKFGKILIISFLLISVLIISVLFYIMWVNRNSIKIPLLNDGASDKSSQSLYETYLKEKSAEKKESTEKLSVSEVIDINEKYIVKIICVANDGDVLATGVVIGRDFEGNLIVLTNYHVVENLKTLPNNPSCMVAYEYKQYNENYYAEPVFWPDKISEEDMWLYDFAFLEVKETPKIDSYTLDENGNEVPYEQSRNLLAIDDFPSICTLDQMNIGEELVVLGYPGISSVDVPIIEFTSVLTATEGIISEKVSDSDFYFNTSAKIGSGNSGGGAFLRNSGCLAGIPTFVVAGELESMGKVLNAFNLRREFLIKVLDINVFDNYFIDD